MTPSKVPQLRENNPPQVLIALPRTPTHSATGTTLEKPSAFLPAEPVGLSDVRTFAVGIRGVRKGAGFGMRGSDIQSFDRIRVMVRATQELGLGLGSSVYQGGTKADWSDKRQTCGWKPDVGKLDPQYIDRPVP